MALITFFKNIVGLPVSINDVFDIRFLSTCHMIVQYFFVRLRITNFLILLEACYLYILLNGLSTVSHCYLFGEYTMALFVLLMSTFTNRTVSVMLRQIVVRRHFHLWHLYHTGVSALAFHNVGLREESNMWVRTV